MKLPFFTRQTRQSQIAQAEQSWKSATQAAFSAQKRKDTRSLHDARQMALPAATSLLKLELGR